MKPPKFPATWADEIRAEIQDGKPHPDAVCVLSLIGSKATNAMRQRFAKEMDERVKANTACTQYGRYNGKRVRWYWPAPANKPRK